MKKLMIAALITGQLAAASPAYAADLGPTPEQRAGAFGGFRLRVPLDGERSRRQVRAGFALAPTLRSQGMDGRSAVRIGEGFEFGYRSNRPLSFSVAGQDLSGRRLGAAQDNEERRRRRFPVGTALLVLGGVIVAGGIAVAVIANEILDNERSGPDGS